MPKGPGVWGGVPKTSAWGGMGGDKAQKKIRSPSAWGVYFHNAGLTLSTKPRGEKEGRYKYEKLCSSVHMCARGLSSVCGGVRGPLL